jgi:hypothetical protein
MDLKERGTVEPKRVEVRPRKNFALAPNCRGKVGIF